MMLFGLLAAVVPLVSFSVWLRRPLTPIDARLSAIDVSIDLGGATAWARELPERTAS